jgi:hypothetical protein
MNPSKLLARTPAVRRFSKTMMKLNSRRLATMEGLSRTAMVHNAIVNLHSARCWEFGYHQSRPQLWAAAVLLDLINSFLNNTQYTIDPNTLLAHPQAAPRR